MIFKAITYMFIIFFCVMGIYSLQFTDKEKAWNNIENATQGSFQKSMDSFKIDPNANNLEDITTNIVKKIAETMIYTMSQMLRIVSRFAVENPQINFYLILRLLYLALILMILIPLIRLFLIIFVFAKDIIAERKYKREIKNLKERRMLQHAKDKIG